MAHKALKGRKKVKKNQGVRHQLAQKKKAKKLSVINKQKSREAKAKKVEEKKARLEAQQAKQEAVKQAKEEAEEQAKQVEEQTKQAVPQAASGKKRKAAEQPDSSPPQAGTEAEPAAAPAAEGVAKKLTKKQRKLSKLQAAAETQHRALYAGGKVLLVGEGNFSFARALGAHLGKTGEVFATCLDGESLLQRKYADAAQIRKELESKHGGTTLVGVDATQLHKVREFRGAFRTIVWNFPHIGAGESDVEKSIADHQRLLVSFFKSALRCLAEEDGASVHVSLKSGEPYKSWKLKQMAQAASPELRLHSVVAFAANAWPGYEHRRTVGFDERFSKRDSEELASGAKVYVFTRSTQGIENVQE